MQEYLTTLLRIRTEYEASDKDTAVSSKAYARKMLKCAGLSRDECRSVLAAAGLWSERASGALLTGCGVLCLARDVQARGRGTTRAGMW